MSVFMDLSVSYTPDRSRLRSLVETAAHRESSAQFGSTSPRFRRFRPPRRDANSASAPRQPGQVPGSPSAVNPVNELGHRRFIPRNYHVKRVLYFNVVIRLQTKPGLKSFSRPRQEELR